MVGRPYLTCALHWPYTAYCNTIAQRIRIFPNRGRGRSVEPLPTTKKNNANNNEGEGRVKVTEMINGFPFRFEIFHHGISLGIENFGKHKYQ